MAATKVTLAPVTGISFNAGVGGSGGGGPPNNGLTASELNDFRISSVIDRLSLHIHGNRKNEAGEFTNLCYSLSRGIDFATANNQIPSRTQELASIVKQVSRTQGDDHLQAAILSLMVSVKSACQCGWFSAGDSEELSNLAKEVFSRFGVVCNTDPSCFHSVISTIMSRFYPRMKMGQIFAFLEVKPGYDAYLADFLITKNLKSSPGDKLRLFVVQTDSIETSSCLVSPAKANFILNGKGVERRTNLFMDTGPQVPTVVTHLLKYGSNLLQALGEFNGHYIVAIAFVSEIPNPDSNALQDYEQQAPATVVDSDSEIIVGPSRISLNCPISFRRIKTPVKGHSCKHIQCFDFDNYVEINSRRPSWRCPHCNQHVCFTDIRIDQYMVKVLKEVGPNVSDIIVSSDGSWKTVNESDDSIKKPEDKTSNMERDESSQPVDVLDLTDSDDAMDDVATYETEDRKNVPIAHQHQFMTQTTANNPLVANTNDGNQSNSHVVNDFWSGLHLPTFGLGSSSARPNTQVAGVSLSTPVVTDSFTSQNREAEAFRGNAFITTPVPQSETSLPNTFQLQQYQFGNQPIRNEYGRFQSLPRHVSRTPVAVQALPAQTPTTVLQQSSRNSVNTFITSGLSAASQASATAPNLSTTARANLRPVPLMSSSPLLQQPIQQNYTFQSTRPSQQNAVFQDPNQVPNPYRFSNERLSPSQQMVNIRMPRSMSQSPGLNQSSMQSSGSFLHPQNHLIAAANRTLHMAVDASRTGLSHSRNLDGRNMLSPGDQRGNTGIMSQPVTRTDAYNPADLNWRPAGRMRGALSGQAYADALNQFIIRPNQQAQATRPISNVTSLPTNVPPHLQTFMAGGVVRGTHSSAGPAGRPMGSDFLPDGSSGTH